MKNLILLFLFGLVFSPAFAQSDSSEVMEYAKGLNLRAVDEGEELMSAGFRNAFSIRVPTGDKRLVRKVWKDYMGSRFNGRTKYDRKNKEYITTNAKISAMGDRNSNLIGKQEKLGNSIRFTIWVENDGSQVRSVSDRRQGREADMILNDFVLEIEREKTRIHLKEEQKQLSQLERDLRKLKAANDRYYREIEMAKERILRMEENIIKNEAEQIEAVERIGQQQEVVKTVKNDLDHIN